MSFNVKELGKEDLEALARIAQSKDFEVVKRLVAAEEHALGQGILGDRESDPIRRYANNEVAYGQMVAMRRFIRLIEDADKFLDEED